MKRSKNKYETKTIDYDTYCDYYIYKTEWKYIILIFVDYKIYKKMFKL